MDKATLLTHGFIERTYPGQVGVYLIKEGLVMDFPYAREHIGGIDVSQEADAVMEVTPDGKVQFMIAAIDYVEGPLALDTEEGQALLKDGIAAKVTPRT